MKRNYKVALVAVIVALAGVSIAYAALSTTLNITVNQVTQNALTWNVAFITGTVNATAEGTSATGRTCGAATVTATTVTVAATTLSKPGDGCVYKLQVKNSGTIAAKLGTITPTQPTGTGVSCGTASGGNMVCGNITYKITTDAAGSTLATSSNTTVAIGATKDLYLVVRYNSDALATTAVTQSGAQFALPFNQA